MKRLSSLSSLALVFALTACQVIAGIDDRELAGDVPAREDVAAPEATPRRPEATRAPADRSPAGAADRSPAAPAGAAARARVVRARAAT